MELYKEILVNILAKKEITVLFPSMETDVKEIVEAQCYKALQKIKAVIEDNSLNDFECIEEIVCIFEEMGSNCGVRHDF